VENKYKCNLYVT